MKRAVVLLSGFFCFLLIFLFSYATIKALFDYPQFLALLRAMPWLGQYASLIGIIIPVVQGAIVMLLLFPRYRRAGWFLAGLTTAVYTLYFLFMLTTPTSLPCACMGIIDGFTWKGQLWFNSAISTIAFIIYKTSLRDSAPRSIPGLNLGRRRQAEPKTCINE